SRPILCRSDHVSQLSCRCSVRSKPAARSISFDPPRRDMVEVRERLRWDGSVEEPLREADFEPIVEMIRRQEIGAVAGCFLHSYLNPAHELGAREVLLKSLPELSVTLSHEVAREWREYERASSAVLNAYIAPIVERYLARLEAELQDVGVSRQLHIMQSNAEPLTAP